MPEDKGEKLESKGGIKPETPADPHQPPKEGWKPEETIANNPKVFTKEDMEKAGFIDPTTGKDHPIIKGAIRLQANLGAGIIETVITPSNSELNMIIKPFCKIDSPAGEALINSGVVTLPEK